MTRIDLEVRVDRRICVTRHIRKDRKDEADMAHTDVERRILSR